MIKNTTIFLLLVCLYFVHTNGAKYYYEALTEGMVKVNVTCTTDARGVRFCRDRKTGRTWTISPSPVGTYIQT